MFCLRVKIYELASCFFSPADSGEVPQHLTSVLLDPNPASKVTGPRVSSSPKAHRVGHIFLFQDVLPFNFRSSRISEMMLPAAHFLWNLLWGDLSVLPTPSPSSLAALFYGTRSWPGKQRAKKQDPEKIGKENENFWVLGNEGRGCLALAVEARGLSREKCSIHLGTREHRPKIGTYKNTGALKRKKKVIDTKLWKEDQTDRKALSIVCFNPLSLWTSSQESLLKTAPYDGSSAFLAYKSEVALVQKPRERER